MKVKEFIKNNQIKIVLSFICLTLLATVYIGFTSFMGKYTAEKEFIRMIETGADDEDDIIYVHIKGAVANPGLYELKRACRVKDAIDAAGGFTEDADSELINLAEFVEDGAQLVIASKSGTAPDGDEGGSGNVGDTRIDINKADKSTLMSLDGIGEKTAERIIKYRETNGTFTSISQIKNVEGIGDKKFENIKDSIKVG